MPLLSRPSLAEQVSRLEARLASLRGLQQQISALEELIEKDPTIRADAARAIRELAEKLAPPVATDRQANGPRVIVKPATFFGGGSSSPSREEGLEAEVEVDEETARSCVAKMIQFLRERNNEPAKIADFMGVTGAAPATIRQIIYRRHKDKFVKAPVPSSPLVHWKLAGPLLTEEGQ